MMKHQLIFDYDEFTEELKKLVDNIVWLHNQPVENKIAGGIEQEAIFAIYRVFGIDLNDTENTK
jgi:hypothetical protein